MLFNKSTSSLIRNIILKLPNHWRNTVANGSHQNVWLWQLRPNTVLTALLPKNTVIRRNESMSQDVKEQLLTGIKCSPKFPIQTDPSTDVGSPDTALKKTFIKILRYVVICPRLWMTVSLQKIFQGHLYGRSNNFDRTHERFSRRSDTNNSQYKLPVPPPRQTKIQLCTLREISSKLYHVEIKKSPLFPSFFNL